MRFRIAGQVTWPLFGVFVTLVSVVGCQSEASPPGPNPLDAPLKVIVSFPVAQEVQDFMDYTGRTESVETVEIRPRVSGYLTKVAFMGSLEAEVKAGDLLFQIDERPYKIALASAEARLASAKAAQTTAGAELERTEGLFKKGVVVQSELDRDVGHKAQADAEILSAQAAIDQANLDLEFTTIKSPIDGIISKPTYTIGNLVTPATQSLTTIVSYNPIYVYFDLDEPSMLQIQANVRSGKLPTREEGGYKILLGLANNSDYPYSGTLDFIDNRVDPNTGTIRVRGNFENPKPDRGSRVLVPGLFARVRAPMGAPQRRLLVTERAIGRNLGKTFVYVAGPDNTVGTREIQLGPIHEGLRVVLTGLEETDKVVVGGLQRIRPGSVVDPVEKPMPVGDHD